MRLAEEVNRKLGSAEIIRYGVVSEIDGDSLSITASGETVADLPWLDSYTPVAGDRVAVLCSRSSWLVLGKVTAPESAYGEPVTIEVLPDGYWVRQRTLHSEAWDGHYEEDGTPVWDPQLPDIFEDPNWPATSMWEFDSSYRADQIQQVLGVGRPPQGDSSLINYKAPLREWWLALHYPSLAGLLPPQAEVVDMTMAVRNDGTRSWGALQGRPEIVAHGIDLDLDASLVERDGSLPPFEFVEGYENWNAGLVAPGQTASFEVPADFIDGLLDGTLTGLAFWGPGTGMYVSDLTEFLDNGPPWQRWITNVKPFALRVTYVVEDTID